MRVARDARPSMGSLMRTNEAAAEVKVLEAGVEGARDQLG
jgi:hypothetical protein